MDNAIDYRQRAREQDIAAGAAQSRMARLMHKKAADRWNTIADRIEQGQFAPEAFR